MQLVPIGMIHSPVHTPRDMPALGADGEIEIFPPYADALEGVERNSHLIVICWMHEADRTVTRASARKVAPGMPEKGVFALRSPSRPNPISVSTVSLLGKRAERVLAVSYLDMVDGTPVIDIKPYQSGFDCIFSSTNADRSPFLGKMPVERYQANLLREAVGYHGEYCLQVAMAVRMALAASRHLGGDLRRESVRYILGPNPCINDAMIGMTGVRFGNSRLIVPDQWPACSDYCLAVPGRTVIIRIMDHPESIETIWSAPEGKLFSCIVKSE